MPHPLQRSHPVIQFFIEIQRFFQRVWFLLLQRLKQKKLLENNEPSLVQKNNQFIEENKTKFFNTLEKVEKTKNSYQIKSFFYNKKEYKKVLMEQNNACEQLWKTRIMIKTIPQGGNIIMYYDPYKLGFSYYCDQNMSYNLLNSVAMNYVLTYHCYDFFFDECVTPEPSPLLKLLEDDKPEEDGEGNGKGKGKGDESEPKSQKGELNKLELKNVLKNAPFAKLKNYNKATTNTNTNTNTNISNVVSEKEKKEPEKPKERNRFIYLGKVNNFSILKKPPVKVSKLQNTSSIKYSKYSNLFCDSNIESNILSYRDFKNKTNQHKPSSPSSLLKTWQNHDDIY